MVVLCSTPYILAVGKWNGVGGKLAEGESVEDALLRETREEIAVDLKSFRKTGIIRFYFVEKKGCCDVIAIQCVFQPVLVIRPHLF